jgi:hypothetical protein
MNKEEFSRLIANARDISRHMMEILREYEALLMRPDTLVDDGRPNGRDAPVAWRDALSHSRVIENVLDADVVVVTTRDRA